VLRQPIYEKDRLDPVDPAAAPKLDAALLAQFPEGCRDLAYLQTGIGFTVKRDMPTLKGPEAERLYAAWAAWLAGAPLVCGGIALRREQQRWLPWSILWEMLRQAGTTLVFDTPGRGLVEITRSVAEFATSTGMASGLLTLFVRHTSASLLVQENADPLVRGDLERFFTRLVPDGDALFRHRDEGADDMPAHVRAALSATQLSIPLVARRLALGTWQGIYLWEHRVKPHRREVTVHLIGS
jgi:secondary thiamine-phosphate synthase enzyme